MNYKGKLYGKINGVYFEMDENTEDIALLHKKVAKLEKIENLVADEMLKDDDESDLAIIGELIVDELGYYG